MSYLQQLQQNNTNLQNLVAKTEQLPDKEVSKLAQVADRTVTEITEEDLRGVTKIGQDAFSYCKQLTSVFIPSSITDIDQNAFYECSKLTKVCISDLATWCKIKFAGSQRANPLSYARHLYLGDNEITNAVIPVGTTNIYSYAFYGGSSITSVTIPEGVTGIGTYAFYMCNFSSVHIPASVTGISSYAFQMMSTVTSLTFGENSQLEYIGNSAFRGTDIESVTIPSMVTEISDNAFYQCDLLKSVILKPTTPPTIQKNTFGVHADCVFTVPKGCGDAYKTATNWAAYADKIIEGDV